jgi:hypothetical protein
LKLLLALFPILPLAFPVPGFGPPVTLPAGFPEAFRYSPKHSAILPFVKMPDYPLYLTAAYPSPAR